jgi:glycosyltransferase involved in cell wall biosynthesis
MTSPHPLTLVIIPTFNEIDNLAGQVGRVLAVGAAVHVLIVDDSSPDGTGELADTLAKHPNIFALHRRGKSGLGGAYIAGFRWALSQGYEIVVEMDADGSHPATVLPALLAGVRDEVGLVIGSRWVAGGSVVDWPHSRELLSRVANAYARFVLGLRVRDVTGGYRAYAAAVLRSIPLDQIRSRGYGFQIDMTVRTADAGFAVAEIPITFKDREAGVSKMTAGIVVEAMVLVTVWAFVRPVHKLVGSVQRRRAPQVTEPKS